MKRLLSFIICAGLLLGLAGSAQAREPVQTITVVNRAGVTPQVLTHVEYAVQYQANAQLRRWWHTPKITFGPDGWPVTIERTVPDQPGLPTGSAYHRRGPQPSAWVPTLGGGNYWPMLFSHEIVEMLAPQEVCDPTAGYVYTVRGIDVADFVLPAWYVRHSRGPWDIDHNLAYAGQATVSQHEPARYS